MRRFHPSPAVLAAGLSLLWGAALLWPLARAPYPAALGHPEADTFNHLWGYRFVASALAEGRLPLHTEIVGAPEGGSLWFIDLFGALLTLPIQALWGVGAAYNISVVFNLAWASFAMFLLAYKVSRSAAGAAVAAVAYGASPHLLAQIYNGISEGLAAGWLPLVVLTLLRCWEAPSRKRAAQLGLSLALCALSNWYYGMFAALAATGFGVLSLVDRGPRGKLLRPVLPFAALPALALVIPAFLAFRSTLLAEDALVRRDPDFVRKALVGHNMVDALAFFTPGPTPSPDLAALFDEALVVVVYLGWGLLVPALWALLRVPRARPWAALAWLCWVFALGPYLYFAGQYVRTPSGGMLPLPFLALFDGIPLFSAISHAFRFVVPLTLCLGVMAALGLAKTPRLAWALAPLLALELTLGSPVRLPLPVSDLRVPRVYAALEQPGAVIDLPITQQVLSRSRYNLNQLSHERAIPYGLNDPSPIFLDHNRLTRAVMDTERSSIDTLAPTPPLLDLVLGREELLAAGFVAIVVHPERYPAATLYKVTELLDIVLGPGEDVEGRRLYRLTRG